MTRMRLYLRTLLTACLLLLVVAMPAQQIAQLPQDYAVASDYTDCKNSPRFSIPLDLEITESYWLKGYVRDLTQGVSAYLYSDTDFQFEVFIDCFFMLSVYETTFKKNRTSTINFTRIQEKLAENGISDYASPFYIRITPINGKGGRLVMRPDSERMYSDCSNPLLLAPGLNLRSYRTSDVYALDPRDFSHEDDLFVRWYTKDSVSCQAKMTLGACDGEVLEEKTLLLTKEVFRLTPELLTQTAQNNQLLYFHFDHDVDSTSYVQCLASKYTEKVYTKTACQGKGVTIGDTTFYESTYYFRDTAYASGNTFYIRYYDITITEPEPQPDTIGLKSTQLPYTYRGQTITDYGDYDLTISKAKQCDQRYLLHVYHDVDVTLNVTDTFLCYGSSYKYENKIYQSNTSFVKYTWNTPDELVIDSLNLYFATTPTVVYDTIMQGERKYGRTFDQLGDYRFLYEAECTDSIILHVKKLDNVYDYTYVDTTLCQGMVYDHWGVECTMDTVIYDTLPTSEYNRYNIEITTVTFTEPDIQLDTISLKTTQLPYKYNKYCTVDTFGLYDYTVHVDGRCDERYHLLALHDIDTIYQIMDTVLCQGKVYTYDGVEYTTDITLVDTVEQDADTYQVQTIQVTFTAPELQYDTLSLKTTDLPYTYREQYVVDTFGEYDVLIKTQGSCDEVYKLYVSHDIDTTYQTVDTVLCQGKVYTYDGVEYTTSTTLIDSLYLDTDTYQILTTNLWFTAPEQQYDTLGLKTTDLPYTYRSQYEVTDFGNHDVLISYPNTCDEHYQLLVLHDIDTLVYETDTLLCYGKVFVQDTVEYQVDTTLQTVSWLNADTLQIDVLNLYFATLPDEIYETLLLEPSELPYQYRDTIIITFGEYELLLYNEEGCQEQVYLSVVEKKTTTDVDNTSIYDRPRLILRNGVVYILRGYEVYTLLGEKIK